MLLRNEYTAAYTSLGNFCTDLRLPDGVRSESLDTVFTAFINHIHADSLARLPIDGSSGGQAVELVSATDEKKVVAKEKIRLMRKTRVYNAIIASGNGSLLKRFTMMESDWMIANRHKITAAGLTEEVDEKSAGQMEVKVDEFFYVLQDKLAALQSKENTLRAIRGDGEQHDARDESKHARSIRVSSLLFPLFQ
jgi:hypothetical protein